MGIPSDSLLKWVGRHISDLTEEGSISRFELGYDGKAGLFRLEVFELDPDELEDATELATRIHMVAEDDARSRSGHIHRYRVLAYRADELEHESATSITIQGRLSAADPVEMMEPGDEGGVTGQLMRHLEQTQITMMRVVEATSARNLQDLEHERSRRLMLEKDREDIWRLKEELVNNHEERELRRAEEARKAERTDKMLGVFLQTMPLMLQAFAAAISRAGASKSPPSAEEKGVLGELSAFLKSVDEGVLAKFAGSLEPEQQKELFALMSKIDAK